MEDKWEDCTMCICINCYKQYGVDPIKCKYSDCAWYEKEKATIWKDVIDT